EDPAASRPDPRDGLRNVDQDGDRGGVVVSSAVRAATATAQMVVVRRDDDPAVLVSGDGGEHVRAVAPRNGLFEGVESCTAEGREYVFPCLEPARRSGLAPGASIGAKRVNE